MEVLTECGVQIFCLPDSAKCKVTGENLNLMINCPICNFDDYGEICVPDLCDEYSEE